MPIRIRIHGLTDQKLNFLHCKLNVSSSLVSRFPHNHVLRAHDEVVLVLHYIQEMKVKHKNARE